MNDQPTVLNGDALTELRKLPAESVHCCVTSPPYWGLRDYGTASWEGGEEGCDHSKPNRNAETTTMTGGTATLESRHFYNESCGKCGAKRIDSQLGLEKTPEEYVAKMVKVFREVRRVLRKDATCWVNLGDTYNANTGAGFNGNAKRPECARETRLQQPSALPAKNLIGIPWRVAFALQTDGWYLRQDIIWSKPNPMPESVTDRCTKAHEYLFLLTKSARYFYDAEAIKEQVSGSAHKRQPNNGAPASMNFKMQEPGLRNRNNSSFQSYMQDLDPELGRNKRSVWTVATAPYPEAHFATYPPDLIKPCILAGTSAKGCCAKCGAPWERIVDINYTKTQETNNLHKISRLEGDGKWIRMQKNCETLGWQPTCECFRYYDGNKCTSSVIPCTVLDPFAGSGTTGAVALELGRKAVLIELNPKYIELIRDRCNITPGLALA